MRRSALIALAGVAISARAKRAAVAATGIKEAADALATARAAEAQAKESARAGAESAQEAKDATAGAQKALERVEQVVVELQSAAHAERNAELSAIASVRSAERAEAAVGLSAQAAGLALRAWERTAKTEGREGPIGPMPRHEWDRQGTRVRFEIAPGIWGEWSEVLRGSDGYPVLQYMPAGGGGVTEARVVALIEANSMSNLTTPEFLDDQTSSGTVLTFTFSAAVLKAWVELKSTGLTDVSEARVRTDGGTPDSDTGAIIHAGSPMPFSGSITTVKVLADSGKVVGVYGYR